MQSLVLGAAAIGLFYQSAVDGSCLGSEPGDPLAEVSAVVSQAEAEGAGRPLPPRQFIDLIAPMALRAEEQTGVPAAVTIAQAILESGWGRTAHTMQNNLFGIKGSGDAGSGVVWTREYSGGEWHSVSDRFAAYRSLSSAIEAHDRLLSGSPLYRSAMDVRGDPERFARELQQDGYATDPGYATKLISLIRRYHLSRYDSARPDASGS